MKGSRGDFLVQHVQGGGLNELIAEFLPSQYTKLPNVAESLCATLLSEHPKAHYTCRFAHLAPIGTHFKCSKNGSVIFLVGKQGPETIRRPPTASEAAFIAVGSMS